MPLKSIPRTEYIVLPYNTRAPTLWTPSGDTIPAGKRVVKWDTQLWTPLNFEQTVRPNPNLACGRRQISITPRRLYVIILRTFVIRPSTVVKLTIVESGSRRSTFRSQHEGDYPVLSGTLPLPQVTMAKNVHRTQKCAMTGCPQIYNPLILKVAKHDLWTYRSQLSNRQGYPETGLPLTAENSAANLFPASGERPYSKISEIAIGGAKMFYQSLLKNVRRASILYFRHKWRCVWQTLWLESKSAHNSVAFHDANGYAQK